MNTTADVSNVLSYPADRLGVPNLGDCGESIPALNPQPAAEPSAMVTEPPSKDLPR
jgi:hypothetical protein